MKMPKSGRFWLGNNDVNVSIFMNSLLVQPCEAEANRKRDSGIIWQYYKAGPSDEWTNISTTDQVSNRTWRAGRFGGIRQESQVAFAPFASENSSVPDRGLRENGDEVQSTSINLFGLKFVG